VFMLPRFMQAVAPWLPQYHLGQLALTITGGARDTNIAGHVMALALWTLGGLAAATWAYRRDEGKLYG
jgi:ABC-2 type transport system permease protein